MSSVASRQEHELSSPVMWMRRFPVFWNGDAYRLDARLRYRVRDGKLTFWFELIRQDKVLEAATQTLIAQIREKTGNPLFFGEPFAQQ